MLYLKKIEKNTWKYHYFTPVHQKAWWSDLQFLRYWVKLVIMGHFCTPLTCTTTTILNTTTTTTTTTTPSNPKKQNFEKNGKIAGDIIILHMCTKNHNHLRYGSWDTEWDRQFLCNFGPFWALLPPPLTTHKTIT